MPPHYFALDIVNRFKYFEHHLTFKHVKILQPQSAFVGSQLVNISFKHSRYLFLWLELSTDYSASLKHIESCNGSKLHIFKRCFVGESPALAAIVPINIPDSWRENVACKIPLHSVFQFFSSSFSSNFLWRMHTMHLVCICLWCWILLGLFPWDIIPSTLATLEEQSSILYCLTKYRFTWYM